MRLFKSLILLSAIGTFSQAITLKELITSTLENNQNLKSIQSQTISKQK